MNPDLSARLYLASDLALHFQRKVARDMSRKNQLADIRRIINDNKGDTDGTIKALLSSKIPHLSYSRVSTYEFCPRAYYLEYVRQVRLVPEPEYFRKGKVFHRAAQRLYSSVPPSSARSPLNGNSLRGVKKAEDKRHLRNAVALMLENKWGPEWEIVGVERPLVMSLHEELPPFFGIIDLVLKKGSRYAVVDHKTCASFREQDPLQLVLYREFVRAEYGAIKVEAYYDQYRWVNNLDRIRKPAFMRNKVRVGSGEIGKALTRVRRSYKGISEMREPPGMSDIEKCYGCRFRLMCY